MRRIREVLRLKFQFQLNDTQVANGAGISRSTVQAYLTRIAASGLTYEQLLALDDEALDKRLFPPRGASASGRPLPDWETIERDMRGRGVTLRLLWEEYLGGVHNGYKYTQFLRLYRHWQSISRPPVMRQVHIAGAALQVDYAGMTRTVIDMGQPREAQIFVACLPCSQLIYTEATWTQGHEDWLSAHVRALAWIGGCPEKLIPDNLKSGVTNASYYDPVLNRSYHELARHYNMAVLPARVRRPRDKSAVESAVNLVERWVLAPLRNRAFFSLDETNAALMEQAEALNQRPFSPPREGSRRSLFEAIERAALKPLPATPFAIGRWMTARVNIDYHIVVDLHYYSVPYRFLGDKVDVFVSANAVGIFAKGERIACHARSHRPSEHTTLPEHMPPAHQAMARRTPDHLRAQAAHSAWPLGSMSIVCSTPASTLNRVYDPASVCFASPKPTARPDWNWPANGRWPRARSRHVMLSICSVLISANRFWKHRPTKGLANTPTFVAPNITAIEEKRHAASICRKTARASLNRDGPRA